VSISYTIPTSPCAACRQGLTAPEPHTCTYGDQYRRARHQGATPADAFSLVGQAIEMIGQHDVRYTCDTPEIAAALGLLLQARDLLRLPEPGGTCGHERATFRLEGVAYCQRCAPYAWARYTHRGHPDEPPAK